MMDVTSNRTTCLGLNPHINFDVVKASFCEAAGGQARPAWVAIRTSPSADSQAERAVRNDKLLAKQPATELRGRFVAAQHQSGHYPMAAQWLKPVDGETEIGQVVVPASIFTSAALTKADAMFMMLSRCGDTDDNTHDYWTDPLIELESKEKYPPSTSHSSCERTVITRFNDVRGNEVLVPQLIGATESAAVTQ
jgi:hypothetical protein